MENENNLAYLDIQCSIDKRVKDLISRLTIEEKISQMHYKSNAIPRLNIPAYNWWNESLHGIARAGKATVFPQAIALAATFDRDLIKKIAQTISDEARAKYHDPKNTLKNTQYMGLTFWSPNINIFRDPRWGRGQETYGEDPYLTAEIGKSYVKGLQGEDPKYLKTAACAKHFAAHSGPEKLRHKFNAIVNNKDLHETYLFAFKELINSGVESVMGAYNQVNGEPCCGSGTLLKDILRTKFNFQGYIVSDCWAVRDFHESYQITQNPTESIALAVNNGCNLNCGNMNEFLLAAFRKNLVNETTIDNALYYILKTRFRLGMFDPEDQNPYTKISPDIICSKEHKELAKKAALKSIVLLKNNKNILPIQKKFRKIMVIGPNASNVDCLFGNYHGLSDRMPTILEGIVNIAGDERNIVYRAGSLLNQDNPNPVNYGLFDINEVDIVIAVYGLHPILEGEEGDAILSKESGDKIDITLPKCQLEFLKKIKDVGKPIILVLTGGSPISIPEDIADAILFTWYPGEQGGNALAEIIFGIESPSGRLPITFPKSIADLPPYENYDMKNRTYRYSNCDPLFPFGYGLSYSKFEYEFKSISSEILTKEKNIKIEIGINNIGEYGADDVIQLYITKKSTIIEANPLYSLKNFRRIYIKAGETILTTFIINKKMLITFNQDGEEILIPGDYTIYIGGSCPCDRSEVLGISKPIIQKIKYE